MTKLDEVFELQKHKKLTENGDDTFDTTGSKLLDLLFMSEYYQTHLKEAASLVDESERDQLFAMFMRDPRFGLGRRDLGRALMLKSRVQPEDVVKAGRFDDLLESNSAAYFVYLYDQVKAGNELAKKWCPRFNTSNEKLAKQLAKRWHMTEKEYRKFIKCASTTEYKLSHNELNRIKFEQVPSLAMIKYFKAFQRKMPEDFKKYIESVKKGETKLNVSTTNVYDIYKNRNTIEAQLFFDKLEKIKISCIPVLDTSGSMQDSNDSIGKATSIAHYLSKCSSYCPNQVVTFSSHPQLITMGKDRKGFEEKSYWGNSRTFGAFKSNPNTSDYINEINSLYTGDCSHTDFGKVMELLSNLDEELPQYLVVLSDMEFDCGSNRSKAETMKLFKSKGYDTRIIWWNFNSRNTTCPEMDKDGNIYISGYSPFLLKYLESGFDGNKFLNKLLEQYKKNIDN